MFSTHFFYKRVRLYFKYLILLHIKKPVKLSRLKYKFLRDRDLPEW